jgi:two-component system invasion response regulator UvrY
MMKVLIADDHAVVRKGLKQILCDAPDITSVVEAADGEEALQKARSENIDVVLLDITMPGRSGIDTLTQLKREHPNLPVVVLSIHSEEEYGARVLKSGASGYVSKNSPAEELIAAVRKATTGGRYVSPALAEKLADRLNTEDPETPLHEKLSDREYEVFRQLAVGKSIKQIAQKLNLSEKTISTYRSRILEKLHMRNNSEVIHYAVREGLAD